MTDLTLHLQFKNLYQNFPQWREQVDFKEENNMEWEEFLNVGNSFFLSEFDREFIYHIYPADKDLIMMKKHCEDLPSRPIYESNLETELSLKTQSCFFDIFLIKKTYATWLEKKIYPIIDKVMQQNDGSDIYLDLSDYLDDLQNSMMGMVYYSLHNDFDTQDTLLNTELLCSEAKKSHINAEMALMDMAFTLKQLNVETDIDLFEILHAPFSDLAYDLGIF